MRLYFAPLDRKMQEKNKAYSLFIKLAQKANYWFIKSIKQWLLPPIPSNELLASSTLNITKSYTILPSHFSPHTHGSQYKLPYSSHFAKEQSLQLNQHSFPSHSLSRSAEHNTHTSLQFFFLSFCKGGTENILHSTLSIKLHFLVWKTKTTEERRSRSKKTIKALEI